MKQGLNKVIKAHIAFEHQENNTFINRRAMLALLEHNLNLESVEEFSDETDINIHLKSFVDLFVISKAQKVYLVYSDLLYRSSFAKTASLLSGTLYEEIKL